MKVLVLLLLSTVVCHRRRAPYVRLPSGRTIATGPFLRDTYQRPSPELSLAAATGSLVAPPRIQQIPQNAYAPSLPQGIGTGSSEGYVIAPGAQVKGINYAQFKQMVQEKTIGPISAPIAPGTLPEMSFVAPGTMVVPPGGMVVAPTDTGIVPDGEGTRAEIGEGLQGEELHETIHSGHEHDNHSHGDSNHPKEGEAKSKEELIAELHASKAHKTDAEKSASKGQTFTTLGGGQFYQSIFSQKKGFSPLDFLLNRGGLGGAGGGASPVLVPVPIVIPPPPPPPPGPKCYTNPSGFLCCNVTLEKTMEEEDIQAYMQAKAEGVSLCNVQKMASAVQEAAEKKFNASFESVAAHGDFVAKINFAGDLNCKIEIDGKYIMAYATPPHEKEVNIIDANSFFSGDADELLEGGNGTDSGKPTYIVYGPIRKR